MCVCDQENRVKKGLEMFTDMSEKSSDDYKNFYQQLGQRNIPAILDVEVWTTERNSLKEYVGSILSMAKISTCTTTVRTVLRARREMRMSLRKKD